MWTLLETSKSKLTMGVIQLKVSTPTFMFYLHVSVWRLFLCGAQYIHSAGFLFPKYRHLLSLSPDFNMFLQEEASFLQVSWMPYGGHQLTSACKALKSYSAWHKIGCYIWLLLYQGLLTIIMRAQRPTSYICSFILSYYYILEH